MNHIRSLGNVPSKHTLAMALAEKARRESLKVIHKRPDGPPDGTPYTSCLHHPDHPLNILTRKARYKVLYGGRGGMKTWGVAERLIELTKSAPLRILCTREYQNTIKDSVHKVLGDTIYRMGLQSWFDITNVSIKSKMGAEFMFIGLKHDPEGIKSKEGIDIIWVEEGQTTSEQSWKILGPTIRKPGSEIWVTMNVNDEDDPSYKRFVLSCPPRSLVRLINYDDNPFLSDELEEERQYAESLILNADNDFERAQAQSDYDHIWLGQPKKISNEVILSGKYVLQDFPDDLWQQEGVRIHLGADYGFSQDPSTLIRVFVLDNVLYVEYEAYGQHVELTEMEQFWDSVPGARVWPIKADNARPETTSFMRGLGFAAASAEKWPGSVEDGITHLRGFKKIVIHPRCKHTYQEAKTWRYKVDPKTSEVLPIVVDKNNHCWDAIRYSLDGHIMRRGDLGIWQRLGKQR